MKTESSAPSEDSLRNKRRSFLAGLVATGLLYATPVLLCVNEAEAHSRPSHRRRRRSSHGSHYSRRSRRSRPSRRHSRPSRNYDYRDRYDDRYDGRYNEGWHREAGDRLRDTFNDALGGFRPDRY
jgi:hypothetical protein